jgi:hypothetical protein
LFVYDFEELQSGAKSRLVFWMPGEDSSCRPFAAENSLIAGNAAALDINSESKLGGGVKQQRNRRRESKEKNGEK